MDRLDNGREYLAAAENGLNMRWPDVHTATTDDYTRATYLAMVDLTRAVIGIGRILDHLTSTATPDNDTTPDDDLPTQCTQIRGDGRRCLLDYGHTWAHVFRTRGTENCAAKSGPTRTPCAYDRGHAGHHLTYAGHPWDSTHGADIITIPVGGEIRCPHTNDGGAQCFRPNSHSGSHQHPHTPPISTYLADGPCPEIPLECLPDGWRNAQTAEIEVLAVMDNGDRCHHMAYTSRGRTIRCARHDHGSTGLHAAPVPGTE